MKVLSLDLSTSATGWAFFEEKKLLDYGVIKPAVKGLTKMTYPEGALRKCLSISEQVSTLVLALEPDLIIIEEINRGKNRLGQKVLDGLHFVLLSFLDACYPINKIYFIDSDGATGWRSKNKLNLTHDSKQKAFNKGVKQENRKIKAENKKRSRESKIELKKEITRKTLACEKANKLFRLKLDDWKNTTDGDIADAILVGYAFIIFDMSQKAV